MHVKVHAANIHDIKAGCGLFECMKEKLPSLKGVSACLAKRWVVERMIAWVNNFRRMAKDFEILTCSIENFIRISMIKIMLDKLG